MSLQPTIRRSLIASSLALVGLVALFAYLVLSASDLRRERALADRWHDHTLEVIIAAGDVDAALHDQAIIAPSIELRDRLERLAELTRDNPGQQRRILRFATLVSSPHAQQDASEIKATLGAIVGEEHRLLDLRLRREEVARHAQHHNMAALIGLGGLLLLCVTFGLVSIAQMALRIQRGSRELADSEARYRLLADHASDLVMRLAPDGTCTYASPSAPELTGFPVSTYVGFKPMVMVHPDDFATALGALDEVRLGDTPTRVVSFRSKHHDGRWLWFEANMRRIDGNGARVSEVVCILRDISERKELEEKLTQQAIIDELTGLYNRRHFMECFATETERATRCERPLSLALIDIDHFKRVNDGHGHAAGDAVLRLTASIIHDTMRGTDIIGRVGGEELAIIMPDTGLEAAHLAVERLRQAISAYRFSICGAETLHVTISIGLAQAKPNEPLSSIMSRADAALYAAKNAGRDRVLQAA